MASKSTLFLLAFVLLVTRMASSFGDFENIETQNHHHHHHHHHAGAPAPVPTMAPVHAPKKAPVHAPKKAPVAHAPAKSPVHSPLPPPPHGVGCVAQCTSYCKTITPKRPCMRTCTACCAKCKCVPGFTKCHSWDTVEIHGHLLKCP